MNRVPKPVTLKAGQSIARDGELIATIVSVSPIAGKVRIRFSTGEVDVCEGESVKVLTGRKRRKPRLTMPKVKQA